MATDFYDVALRDFETLDAACEKRQRYCKRCSNCGDPIEQKKAVHIVIENRNKPMEFWFCDGCVEEFKEDTGYDDE